MDRQHKIVDWVITDRTNKEGGRQTSMGERLFMVWPTLVTRTAKGKQAYILIGGGVKIDKTMIVDEK